MTTALANRNIDLIPGGDLYCRSVDPLGAYFRNQIYTSAVAPVITLQNAFDRTPALGTTYTAVFVSSQTCAWIFKHRPSDDATMTISADTKTATITWVIPAGARKTSEYVGVIALNAGGRAELVDRVHVGATSVRFIGTGETYATLAAAKVGAPSGTRFVIRNAVTGNTNNFVSNASGATATAIPNGVFTTYTDGSGNTRYTVTEFTTYMAETPLGVTLDGNNTNNTCIIAGNHPFEQEFTGYATASGTGAFNGSPVESISRVGIAIKGFYFKRPAGEGAIVLWSRFIQIENCFSECGDPNTFAFLLNRSADCLIENCAATGNYRGAVGVYQCSRTIKRRVINTHQNNSTSEPIQGFSCDYESRNGEFVNAIDIDSWGAYEFWTGPGVQTESFGYPQSNLSTDGYVPDFSLGLICARGLSLENVYGLITTGAWENPAYSDRLVAYDMIGHNLHQYDDGYGTVSGGPIKVVGLTLSRIWNETSQNGPTNSIFFTDYRSPVEVSNALLVGMGWGASGAVNQGCTFSGVNFDNLNSKFDNFCVDETVGPLVGVTANIDITNQVSTDNRLVDGFMYIDRIELNSRFYTLNIGTKNVLTIRGKKGTFYGDAGYNTDINRDWTDSFPYERIAELQRLYSYTGLTQNFGTQTLSGNRGWAQITTNLREYISRTVVNGTTQPVHYPYEFTVQVSPNTSTGGNDVFVYFRRYKKAILEHRVYINGIHSHTVPYDYHCIQILPLRTGTYEVKCTCVSLGGVESGYSRAITVTV